MNNNNDPIKAHEFSSKNMPALQNDRVCGCFYCLRIFSPVQIERRLVSEETALCPYCGIDSIIGESSGYPITEEFIAKMKAYWFGDTDE